MTYAVEVESVDKSYKQIKALENVSLSFEQGIVYGLLGPNGAGKTTLIRVLTTLLPPDAGHARVLGVDVVADPAGVRNLIGLAGQSAAVDEYLTGRENLEMVGRLYNLPRQEALKRADDVLERIHLVDAANRRVKTYSGGMRRRLDLAASLVGRPQVLFLDEPTTGVDPRSRLDLWDLVRELVADGTTLLLTTQYLEEADRLCDRIAVVDRGHLISEGTADELKAKVGGDFVELHVEDADRERVHALLHRVTGEPAWADAATGAVRAAADNGSQTLVEVVRALDQENIIPIDMGLRKPTLDDVFLNLTGHSAEDEPPRRAAQRERGAA